MDVTNDTSLPANKPSHSRGLMIIIAVFALISAYLAFSGLNKKIETVTYTNKKYNFTLQYAKSMQHRFGEDLNKHVPRGIHSLDMETFYKPTVSPTEKDYNGPTLNIFIYPEAGNEVWLTHDSDSSDNESQTYISGQSVKRLQGKRGIRIGPLKRNGMIFKFEMADESPEISTILSTFKFN